MFNQNTIIKKESPFTKFKKPVEIKKVDDFGFETEEEYIEEVISKNSFAVENKSNLFLSLNSYTREELVGLLNIETFSKFLENNKNNDGFIKLFTLKLDFKIKELIRKVIPIREDIVNLNNLPEYMKRDGNNITELKCQATEIPMSDLLRNLNKFNKVKLQTPAVVTLTPEKDKTDFLINNILFDMKGQTENKSININKIAHDRAVSQGLSYYAVGILNSDNLDSLTEVTYYLMPLSYFLKKAKFINTGKYSENPRNHYYSINIENITDADKVMFKEKLENKFPNKLKTSFSKI